MALFSKRGKKRCTRCRKGKASRRELEAPKGTRTPSLLGPFPYGEKGPGDAMHRKEVGQKEERTPALEFKRVTARPAAHPSGSGEVRTLRKKT